MIGGVAREGEEYGEEGKGRGRKREGKGSVS